MLKGRKWISQTSGQRVNQSSRLSRPAAVAEPIAVQTTGHVACSPLVWRLTCVAMLAFATVILSPAQSAHAQVETDKRIADAVATLIKEANALETVSEGVTPRFTRPHPAMSTWGSEMALPVLSRMNQPLTGNDYRDTYIRWHLMWVVKKVDDADRSQMSQRLVRLVKEMPGPLNIKGRREVTHEPVEAYQAWHKAYYSLRIVKGYPPFQQYVNPPESLKELGGDAPARWAEAQRLRGTFKTIVDKDAVTFNRLVRQMNWIIRQYRGELIYSMMQTGDPAMFRLIFSEIDKRARAKDGIAFDLMAYLYLAAFDGLMELYEPSLLTELSQQLEKTARGSDEYVDYAKRKRNFGDYAFHMIYMLRDGASFAGREDITKSPVSKKRRTSTAAKNAKRFTAENLTIEDIEEAVQAGVKALYSLEPPYEIQPEYLLDNRFGRGNQSVRNAMGNHALASWALLSAGESYQNPDLYRRINWVLSSDVSQTYDRGLRMQMLAEMPRDRWAPWVHRDKVWLSGALTVQGNFDDSWYGVADKGAGDNANGQYGVLGLWGAERSGESIRADVWRKIDEYWRKAQQPLPENADPELPAGWAIYTFDKQSEAKGQKALPSNVRVSGPMTAGGVSVLSLTERFLYGDKMASTDAMRRKLPQLRRGVRWLDENFSLNDKEEESDRYYYFWTIQRVGHVTGYRTFNSVDWYRQITATMLNEQTTDGTWNGDKGRLLSTGFSMLYLGKAYDPLAISKIRVNPSQVAPGNTKDRFFDAPWNDKPHDIWNFVDYISDLYESSMTWQIVELDQPVYELIESPILYLSTDSQITFTDKQIDNLYGYLSSGGLLVLNRDQTTGDAAITIRDLMAKLLPKFKRPLGVTDRIDKDHPLATIHMPLRNAPMRVYDDGLRPVIVEFLTDLGAGLQSNDPYGRASDSFNAMSNIFLYTTGMNTRRKRLETNYVPNITKAPSLTVRGARIKHSGNYDPQPAANTQLANIVANDYDIKLQLVDDLPAAKLTRQDNIAFLTTTGDGDLSEEEASAIRSWVKAGGTLWIDAAGGSAEAAAKANEFLAKIMPGSATVPLSSDDPIINAESLGGSDNRYVQFRKFLLLRTGKGNTPRLMGVEVNNRIGVILSNEDITCGLAGLEHWRIFGYTPEYARRLVTNNILAIAKNRR